MPAFGQRIRDFTHLVGADREREVARTRRVVRELLAKPRAEFPAVAVTFEGREMPPHVVDTAWVFARIDCKMTPGLDILAAIAARLPAALAAETQRIARNEPLARHNPDRARVALDAAHAGLPPDELIAPLVLPL